MASISVLSGDCRLPDSRPGNCISGRIRTCDLLVPNQVGMAICPTPIYKSSNQRTRTINLPRIRRMLWPIELGYYLEPVIGVEPTTSWLQVKCSTNWATRAICIDERIRTSNTGFGDRDDTISPHLHFLYSRRESNPHLHELKARCYDQYTHTEVFLQDIA